MSLVRAHALVAQGRNESRACAVLIKPDVTFLVVISTIAGFLLGSSGPTDWTLLLHTLCRSLGTA